MPLSSIVREIFRKPSFYAALLLFALPFSLRAFAALDNVPSTDTAGVQQERFEEESKADSNALEARRKKSEESSIEEEDLQAGPESGKKFLLKGIQVTGNSSIPSPELEALASEWAGKEVSLSTLKRIASKIKTYYRERKFTAAYAYVPPQKISGGVVQITVIEGRIGNILIEDNHWYSERVIRRMIDLKSGEILYFPKLQGNLSELNNQPDLQARAVLKPGSENKTTDIIFKVKDRFPVHLNGDVNNLGTKNTGLTRWGVGVTHNNLLGQMDRLASRVQLGSGAFAVGTQYNIPVGPWHTVLGFSHSYSQVDVGGPFRDLDVKGSASTYGIDILQPVKIVSFLKTALDLGFDIKSVENRVLDRKAGKDELRILNTGINLEQSDSWGRTYYPHSFHFGFADFLGSSNKSEPAATRAGTGGQFFIYRSSFIRYQRLPLGMTFTLRGSMQLTPDRLAPSEQFRLGGAFSVRGYSEGDYLADYGAFLTNEISIPSYFFPEGWKLPFSSQPLRQQIQGVGFFDFGGGKLRHALNGEDHSKGLAGAGGGIKIHLFDRVYARVQWAGRLGDRANDGKNGAFYYGVSAEVP